MNDYEWPIDIDGTVVRHEGDRARLLNLWHEVLNEWGYPNSRRGFWAEKAKDEAFRRYLLRSRA